ncbi:class I SAM-dependent methyltransferase [Colwellia sp. 1_MG-2023]|uniref:class I SAM-dependent methyltransferase n=1 Tax=unclassified Colwellia TaxID=196834 RepID=UPI001C081AE4|nr:MULTISPECIES: class I SAM-dependent methyltransferase [unclassified Colwellia]MBU2924891.1 class I SAM-dependent methyltransferase [Colwellia sp. C2M11]MDO6652879.1 class I SAM-dependent methyltransferase [Colwellia sp. 3_MG-2023]MDO6665881.1 class I SAM-dependent methyltransferase [Colwellia sp. 2_MG-2023]MDO6690254.1 class I SAM-dependent methyltransferase [Colwellia sp. 1_MG-2023]
MDNQNDSLWEWSVFWHSNQLHSCMPVNNESDALAPIWRNFFSELPSGAKILDLGTGNGSLAVQAVAVSHKKHPPFSIHGVDLADIAPAKYVANAKEQLSDVIFHPRTPMEKLPFEADTFDAIGSQFAIEYSTINESLREACRVLKPGGRLRFLLHANDGILKERCRQQYEQAQIILASELFSITTQLLIALNEAETCNTPQAIQTAENLILSVKQVFDELEKRFAGTEERSLIDNLFAAVRNLLGLRKSYEIQVIIKMNEDIKLLLLAQSKRLQSMQNAALDDTTVTEMAEQLHQLNIDNVSLELATTNTGNRSIGYWLSGEKPQRVGEEIL